jgi:CP family cyanate transporter-like MFS transporter
MTDQPSAPSSALARNSFFGLVLGGILLVALTMRAPIIAIAPSLSVVRDDLGISAGTAGLFTTIPVLCFGLGTPLVLALVRRTGINQAVLIGLAGTLVGIVVRSTGGLAVALIGTLIMGLSITVGNVVIPVIIGRDFPGRAPTVTAAYSSALNVGSMLASTLSAPLTGLVGWRVSLAAWGLFAVLAAVVWRPAARRAVPVPLLTEDAESSELAELEEETALPARPMWRRPLVVGMVLAFAAQSFSYYGVSAWLPTLLRDDLGLSASSAGTSSSIFQVVALIGAFAVPAMIAGRLSARFVMLTVCAAWITLPLGLALAPAWWPVWCFFGGAAQGGGFTVIFSVVVARAKDIHDSRRTSATIQGVGYCIGATGPFVVGAVHSLSNSWTVPMLVVAGVIVLMAVGGASAIGPRPAPARG